VLLSAVSASSLSVATVRACPVTSCSITGDGRSEITRLPTQQPPLRQYRVALRRVVMVTIQVAGHHLSTRYQKPNQYKGPPPTTQNSNTLNIASTTFTYTSRSHPSTWSNVDPTHCMSQKPKELAFIKPGFYKFSQHLHPTSTFCTAQW